MKFNKLIIGLGVLGLMSTSCDKAEKQDYTAAPHPRHILLSTATTKSSSKKSRTSSQYRYTAPLLKAKPQLH